MANQQNKESDQRSHQQGAPQKTSDSPSSGNSPTNSGATTGTDEGMSGTSNKDVERSGSGGGTATQMSPQTAGYGGAGQTTGDPGRTPGKAEGVEDPEDDGNE